MYTPLQALMWIPILGLSHPSFPGGQFPVGRLEGASTCHQQHSDFVNTESDS